MKSWAEERKTGTAELLLTMPFSEWELVIGKFLSSYTVILIALILSLPIPISLLPLGHFDGGAIVGEYLGALLLAAVATSAGLLFSALSKNQVSAFLGSLIILLIITLINQITSTFDVPLSLAALINYVSLAFHFESFSKGVIDTRDLAYFILITALLLFINTRVILFRKWS
jgi:ABC-2 type transport system permease protein